MRVLVFMSTDISISGGSSIRARLIIQGLTLLGIKIGVVSWKIPDNISKMGVEFCQLTSVSSFLETIIAFGKQFKPDVCLGITEGFADIVLEASRALGCVCGFDVHAVGIFEILELGSGFGPRLQRFSNSIRWISAYKSANFLIINPPKLLSLMKLINKNSYPIGSMVDLNHFSPSGKKLEHLCGNKIQVFYAGNYLKWQGCSMLLESAEMMLQKDLPYEFSMIISTEINRDKAKLNKFKQTNHINFIDSVKYDEVPTYLRSADILVIPRPSMLSTNYALPNKIGDYMASGRAVLATDIFPHRFVIRNGHTGILCPSNPSGLMEGFLKLKDTNFREELGKNARKYAEQNFDYVEACKKIIDIMQMNLC